MAESLNVIALISGGKDSFYNVLHCIHHGHRIVALANLYPAEGADRSVQCIDPDKDLPRAKLPGDDVDGSDTDLNSFMYQTVGHEIVPLYASATGIPLYRQPIVGVATHHERDYDYSQEQRTPLGAESEETESMIPLLSFIKARHPNANALCAGAILSTYQRTRVESVALRLGLTPLAYLWKYPVLPSPTPKVDDTQLLRDMALAGLDARIIKVASAGLDENFLWKQVSSTDGADSVKKSLRRYGTGSGAALGEGGEFETIVVDGPGHLFQKRIFLPKEGRKAVHEGGGATWLATRGARLEDKHANEQNHVREPSILDDSFEALLSEVTANQLSTPTSPISSQAQTVSKLCNVLSAEQIGPLQETFMASGLSDLATIEDETRDVANQIRCYVSSRNATTAEITNTIVVLRRMADFPKVNRVYGQLFDRPNPPSRVTISCGDLLPEKCHIMISVALPSKPNDSGRHGLHVQSRSYWAPANIGPYSQAVRTNLLGCRDTEPKGLTIAGQIPLVPATMLLPAKPDSYIPKSVVLSLQHLWRIGAEMEVQLWTSAVAYFPRAASAVGMQTSVRLAGYAWKQIHAQKEDEDEADTGPDLWDMKYNPEYMTLNLAGQDHAVPLPDVDIFSLRQQNEPDSCIPPMFSVEVEELPRGSPIEWHAHLGLSHVGSGQAEMIRLDLGHGCRAWHVVVKCLREAFIHTVIDGPFKPGLTSWPHLKEELQDIYDSAMSTFEHETVSEGMGLMPYLTYTHGLPKGVDHRDSALIPCHSIWSATGQQRGWIGLWKKTMSL